MKIGSTVSKNLNYHLSHKLRYVLNGNEDVDDVKFSFILTDVANNSYRLIRVIYNEFS
jgi:hypothetical protein